MPDNRAARRAIDIALEMVLEAREEERERCARIAELHAEYLRLPVPFSGSVTFRVAQEIAARIRNPDSSENR